MPVYTNDTIIKYINFVYLRMKDGFIISDDECEDTYKYYKDYCQESSLTPMGFHIFYRELRKIGIKAKQYCYPSGKRVRRRVFNFIQLDKFFNNGAVTIPEPTTQNITMCVNNHWLNITIKIEEIKVENLNNTESESATSESENNN